MTLRQLGPEFSVRIGGTGDSETLAEPVDADLAGVRRTGHSGLSLYGQCSALFCHVVGRASLAQ